MLASGPSVGSTAPGFQEETAHGGEISLESYRGRVVVLDFFAVWCGPCKTATANFNSLTQHYASDPDVALIAVHYDDRYEKWESIEKYLDHHDYNFPVIADGSDIVESYGIKKIPAILVLDTDLQVIHRQWGLQRSDLLRIQQIVSDAVANGG